MTTHHHDDDRTLEGLAARVERLELALWQLRTTLGAAGQCLAAAAERTDDEYGGDYRPDEAYPRPALFVATGASMASSETDPLVKIYEGGSFTKEEE